MKISLYIASTLLFVLACLLGNVLAGSDRNLRFKKHVVMEKMVSTMKHSDC